MQAARYELKRKPNLVGGDAYSCRQSTDIDGDGSRLITDQSIADRPCKRQAGI
jgi:hypothetical protein